MAIDVYLQIDGIKGESRDDQHRDWIEVSGVHWGVHQPRSATASTGGGHTAERADLTDMSLTKVADLSTPILLQTCAMGKTLPKAKLEFFRADGNGTRVKYFEIELENVLIGMVKPHLGGADSYLSETFNLKSLLRLGFHEITVDDPATFNFLRGDVMVMEPYKGSKNNAGHVAGFDGKDWISDFVQRDFWAGPDYRKQRPHYVVYRY